MRFITIEQFMKRFGVSLWKTYKLMREKRIRAVKDGRKTMLDEQSCEEWAGSLPAWAPGNLSIGKGAGQDAPAQEASAEKAPDEEA